MSQGHRGDEVAQQEEDQPQASPPPRFGKNRLLDAVATEAMVRTQVNPEAYIDLVESSPQYRWIEPTEDQWRRAGLWGLLQESGGPMPKTTVEACRRLWPQIMADGYRFARLGVEPTGVRIKVSVIRSSRQPFELFDLYSEGQRHYWLDVPMRSSLFKFREPVRTPEEALAGRPSLIVAESNELIETDNGLLATWRLFWYLDPDSGRWVCHYGVVAGGRLVKAFF